MRVSSVGCVGLLALAVGCSDAREITGPPGGSGAGASAGTGGAGVGGAAGTGGSNVGGSAGAEPVCGEEPSVFTARVDGASAATIAAGSQFLAEPSGRWIARATFGELETYAWGASLVEPVRGAAHVVRGDQHYCAELEHSLPELGDPVSLKRYTGFGALGACTEANGATTELNYCYRAPEFFGTAPADCPPGEAHVWGALGATPVDQQASVAFEQAEADGAVLTGYLAQGPAGVIQLIDSAASSENRAEIGFMRLDVAGESVLACVKGVSGNYREHLTQLTLEVVPLGSCPGTPTEGGISACY